MELPNKWIYDYIDNLKLKIILPYFTHKDWLCWCSMLHFQRCSLPRRTQGVRLALEELRSARRSTHRGDGEKNFAMISHHFSPSFVTQNWLRHTSPCHRNWGYLHFLFINHSDHSPLKTRVMISDDPELLSNHPIWGPKCCFSPDRPKVQKQGPRLEVPLDQEKENLIRAKTVLSGMWEDWAFGLRRNQVG